MSGIDDLIDVIDGARAHDLRWELKQLRTIRDWAVKQACDFTEGDRVVILPTLTIESNNGWWTYREALAAGATATVGQIDFNAHHGYWGANIVLDREWGVGDFQGVQRYWHGSIESTPEGYEPPSAYDQETYPEGRKHTFCVPVRHLARASTEAAP